jgi:beta-xylosidase
MKLTCAAELQLGWYHLRTPLRQCYVLEPGRLALYGNAYTVDMQESPAMLLRKQTSYTQTWSTQVSLNSETETHEAGSIVFWSRYSYIALFLRKDQVVVRWVDENTDETKELVGPASHGPTTLSIRAEPSTYTCSYRSGDMMGSKDLTALPSTVIQRQRMFESPYTGAHFGLFAQDTSFEQFLAPAYFDYASLTVS